MKKTDLKRALKQALKSDHRTIAKMAHDGQLQGLEKRCADAFCAALPTGASQREVDLRDVGGRQLIAGKTRGILDCLITAGPSGIEFKTMRLPRAKGVGQAGALYDIGQLTADYARLADAKKLQGGWVVAFLYGPQVNAAASDGELYRMVHNQLFVDAEIARRDPDGDQWAGGDHRKHQRRALRLMGLDKPHPGNSQPPDAFAVKEGELGAVAFWAEPLRRAKSADSTLRRKR